MIKFNDLVSVLAVLLRVMTILVFFLVAGCQDEPGAGFPIPEAASLAPAIALNFKLQDIKTEILDRSFTPYYSLTGVVKGSAGVPMAPDLLVNGISVQAVLAYQLFLNSSIYLDQGQTTVTLIPNSEGHFEGLMELFLPLPEHGLGETQLQVVWSLVGWYPLYESPFQVMVR